MSRRKAQQEYGRERRSPRRLGISQLRKPLVWAAFVSAVAFTSACDELIVIGRLPDGTAAGGGAGAGGVAAGAAGSGGAAAIGGTAAGGAAGAGGKALLVWDASHEAGTTDEWLADGLGVQSALEGGALSVQSAVARGAGALRCEVAPLNGVRSQALLGRNVQLNAARFSAWYFLPEAPVADTVVLMKLSAGPAIDRFDIDLNAPAGSPVRLRLFEHGVGWSGEPVAVEFPIGRWVRLEVELLAPDAGDGRLRIFQDGALVLDTGSRPVQFTGTVVFYAGLVAEYVAPSPFIGYVDDVSIRELGP